MLLIRSPCPIASSTVLPPVTRPKIVYVPSRCGCAECVMKYWLPPVSGPGIAILNHKVRYHPVPARAVEISAVDEIDERRDGERSLGGEQLDLQRAAIGLDKDVRIRPSERRRQPAACHVTIIGYSAAGRNRHGRSP